MDGTPERTWLAIAGMHLEVHLCSHHFCCSRRARPVPPKPTVDCTPSQPNPTNALNPLLQLLYSFLHWRACDTRSETWGTPGAPQGGLEGGWLSCLFLLHCCMSVQKYSEIRTFYTFYNQSFNYSAAQRCVFPVSFQVDLLLWK